MTSLTRVTAPAEGCALRADSTKPLSPRATRFGMLDLLQFVRTATGGATSIASGVNDFEWKGPGGTPVDGREADDEP